MEKPAVKALAAEIGLSVAHKPESMGVCFVGDANMRDFLAEFIETKPGDIIDIDTGEKLGVHDGAIFYTLGQRHGLNIGVGLPHYVVKKDMEKNIVYVSQNLNSLKLWTNQVKLKDVILRHGDDGRHIKARIRHRAPLVDADYQDGILTFAEEQKYKTQNYPDCALVAGVAEHHHYGVENKVFDRRLDKIQNCKVD